MSLVMFESTKIRTNKLEPNENISFHIATIFLVDKLYEVLNLCDISGKHKTKGIDINCLLRTLINSKLPDNFSIKRYHDRINLRKMIAEFSLPSYIERTLYRILVILGAIRMKSSLTSRMSFFLGMILTIPTSTWTGPTWFFMGMRPGLESMDTAGITDQRKQIPVGVIELSGPKNNPIGMTIEPGNHTDQTHFKNSRYSRLREVSLVIFDKGANRIANTLMFRADNLQYLTGKKLNKSDDKIIAKFEISNPQVIDDESGILGN
ncbi:IS1634 family transposase ISMac23 [anaerobic digester metagenome]